MKRLFGAVVITVFFFGLSSPVRAEDKDATAVVDNAIKAMGGEEKLAKAKAFSWKGKGKTTFGGHESEVSVQATVQGIDQSRQEFELEFEGGGKKFQVIQVLAGDKGWRRFDDTGGELDKNDLANQKRGAYLQVVPTTLLQLKGKGFKIEAGAEEKVGGKAAVGIKATGPDGKDFALFFDKESGLPVKLVAKVAGLQGEEVMTETTYGGYKEFDGIKKATKIESKHDGHKVQELQITEFKILNKVDPKTFEEPK